ncbi:hypothetical protein [Actinomadura macrotermitis]|uniref:Uncharacterized protein n=1 Tax=Actinomadura macrotermitis TaxID=2585200 RepID=A0A7K0BY19_9ACTN|nr:hypothetical protein [Actinomadura macrotermitis]MQY05752.1 hypothetical protein [Actinomadura macrotermitis]
MNRKLRTKLMVVALLTALIAGAMLATGPDESGAAARSAAGSVR